MNKCNFGQFEDDRACQKQATHFFRTKRLRGVFASTGLSVMARCDEHVTQLAQTTANMREAITEDEYTVALVMES
jgi:hypothetical protein